MHITEVPFDTRTQSNPVVIDPVSEGTIAGTYRLVASCFRVITAPYLQRTGYTPAGTITAVKIDAYEFGRIAIDGNTYSSDVIVYPKIVRDGWWRKSGHRLAIEDLSDVLATDPEMLIIGTGYHGRMKVPNETRSYLSKQGIEVLELKTSEAVAEFNRLQQRCANIVAALHLTC